jgi:hypothetical protein
MAEKFQEYLDAEMQIMIADLEDNYPVDSPDFNKAAMAWIRKNAARFRQAWECQAQ